MAMYKPETTEISTAVQKGLSGQNLTLMVPNVDQKTRQVVPVEAKTGPVQTLSLEELYGNRGFPVPPKKRGFGMIIDGVCYRVQVTEVTFKKRSSKESKPAPSVQPTVVPVV